MDKDGGAPGSGQRVSMRLYPRTSPRRAPYRAIRRDLARARREADAGESLGSPEASPRAEERHLVVALDSEGTVLDSTRPRHELCYAPAFAAIFGEGADPEAMKEVWRFVSLGSRLRDANRFRQLAAAIRNAARRPELASRLRGEERVASALEAWLASGADCGGKALAAALESRALDRCLFRALDWSLAVDSALRLLPPPLAFSGAMEALPSIADRAEILVLSGGSSEEARREWAAAGIAGRASRFMGGELGDKATRLESLRAERDGDRILFVGDATGDLEAARRAGASFFPIEPGEEDESWAHLASAYLPRFAAGEAPREPLAGFLAALATPPRWR